MTEAQQKEAIELLEHAENALGKTSALGMLIREFLATTDFNESTDDIFS